jgi:hypothetical protein
MERSAHRSHGSRWFFSPSKYSNLSSNFRDRGAILGRRVFPYLFTVKGASALFLFNQRLRQGLRQRLRRVNKASASRQQGRRRLFFVENILLSFLDFETCRKTIEKRMN